MSVDMGFDQSERDHRKKDVTEIHYHYHYPELDMNIKKVLENQNSIIQKLETLMALIDDLKQQVSDLKQGQVDLQASVDAEQAQIQALLDTNAQVVTDLNQQIAVLQDQVANGATPAQLQEVITSLTEVKDSLATTKADIEGTVQP